MHTLIKLSIFIIIFLIVFIWFCIQKLTKSVYQPEFFKSSPSPEEPITILTYNIQKFPFSMKSFTPLYELFKDYSIILLQECFDETLESLPTIFPHYSIFRGTLRGINVMNSGLVILSKFPILKGEFVEYKHYNGFTFDALSEKGFLSVLIDIHGKKTRIINTHLQSCDFERYDVQALLQLDELFDYMDTIYDPYYIIGGDFNIDIEEMKEKYEKYRGLPSLHYPEDPTIYINFTTSQSRSTRKLGYDGLVIDYFVTSKNIEMKKPITLTYTYSDHNPVGTHFKMIE